MNQYEPMEVLTSVREPFNKNTLWIYPTGEDIEVKIYDKGWRIIFSTKDLAQSKQQVINLVNEFKETFNSKFIKEQGKQKSSLLKIMNKNRELEQKITELENKVDKLTKRYGTLLVKN